MDEYTIVDQVAEALRHLRAFYATLNEGEIVDEQSRLSAGDLSVLITVMDGLEAMAEQALYTGQ